MVIEKLITYFMSDEAAFCVASNKGKLHGWVAQSPKKALKRKNVLSEPRESNEARRSKRITVI
jgi:hypothetical protein